jgi:putative ABC transport system permease protein
VNVFEEGSPFQVFLNKMTDLLILNLITLLLCLPANAILKAVTDMDNIRAVLPVGPAFALIGISMLLTLIAGLIPSRIAAKKDPVVALRSE